MKKFSILVLLLSMMFAPFVFAVDIGQSVSEMPEYMIPVIDAIQPKIGANCRDVMDGKNVMFVYIQTGRTASPHVTYKNQTWKGAGDSDIKNHKEGDSYQTDRTV